MVTSIPSGDIRVFTPKEAAVSSIIDPLSTLINDAYTYGHIKNRQLLPESLKRLEKSHQLIDEIGPNGFVSVMYSRTADDPSSEPEIIATASAKPYSHDPSSQIHCNDTNLLFKRKYKAEQNAAETDRKADLRQFGTPEEATAAYELIAMAVKPSMQRQGIASQLLDACIDEIIRRAKEVDESQGVRSGKIDLLISTLQEMSEGFYAKKGWRTTNTKTFKPGVSGSVEGFHIVDMVRRLEY